MYTVASGLNDPGGSLCDYVTELGFVDLMVGNKSISRYLRDDGGSDGKGVEPLATMRDMNIDCLP